VLEGQNPSIFFPALSFFSSPLNPRHFMALPAGFG